MTRPFTDAEIAVLADAVADIRNANELRRLRERPRLSEGVWLAFGTVAALALIVGFIIGSGI